MGGGCDFLWDRRSGASKANSRSGLVCLLKYVYCFRFACFEQRRMLFLGAVLFVFLLFCQLCLKQFLVSCFGAKGGTSFSAVAFLGEWFWLGLGFA